MLGTLLLILFIVFVVIPLLRVGAFFWRARRQYNRFVNESARQQQAYADDLRNRRAGRYGARQRRPKRYAPTDGEYVAFEEIQVDASTKASASSGETYSETYSETSAEERITDAEWEDIR